MSLSWSIVAIAVVKYLGATYTNFYLGRGKPRQRDLTANQMQLAA